jgi:hypothetical protein
MYLATKGSCNPVEVSTATEAQKLFIIGLVWLVLGWVP